MEILDAWTPTPPAAKPHVRVGWKDGDGRWREACGACNRTWPCDAPDAEESDQRRGV